MKIERTHTLKREKIVFVTLFVSRTQHNHFNKEIKQPSAKQTS